jgi:dienelactone hydrolase
MLRILLFLVSAALAAASPWDMKALGKAPHYETASGFEEPGVRAIFFDGVPWKGRPTRVFAWYGAPQLAPGQKAPGMVLVHGGGGTAYAEWVRIWNRRGYAAIAIDTGGCVPKPRVKEHPLAVARERHAQAGPEGFGGFGQVDLPHRDQWPYHAVAAAILAHSLLRSFPEVDAKRTGVTGISWGGYTTDIVASVDPRFRFAAPVYGCGFLGEDSAWLATFAKMTDAVRRDWLGTWDPSVYLGQARTPFLWVSGTNDRFYPLPSLQKSYRLTKGRRTLAIRVGMKHSHPDGAAPEEIAAYADAILKKGPGLARIVAQGSTADRVWVRFQPAPPQARAELNYTQDSGPWVNRKWTTVAAEIDAGKGEAHAQPPVCATAFYLNLIDARGLVTSTEHVERKGCAK